MTSFVGRRREVAEIRQRLATSRLVSLVGPGGVGKTRLALRIAAELSRGFADGAWFVELAEVRDPAHLATAVLASLDLRDQTAAQPLQIVMAHLRGRRLLLVIDNCEHLLDDVARLATEILRDAPGVRVITTTREPLQMPGERVVPVPPLELPPEAGVQTLGQLGGNEAVALFCERAAAASGAFQLTGTNQAAVVGLCRRLDGLPLAIELAAVRTRALSAQQILDRLDDRFALLGGGRRAALPRHQTLRVAIDWSFDLLTSAEQTLFRRLSLFAGRFTLDDVDGLCASGRLRLTGVFDLLSSLVDKSLLTKEDVGREACYRLHETMREYATLRLREADEEDAVTQCWLEHYRMACLRQADGARYRLVDWLAWADIEIDNLRAVLDLCVRRGELARGLDVAASLRYYWITHGTTEAVSWLDQLLACRDASPTTLVRACYLRGWLSLLQGDAVAARPWISEAIAVARAGAPKALLSESLSLASTNENVAGDHQAGRRYLDEAEATAAGVEDYPAIIELVVARSVHAIFQSDLASATSVSLDGVRRAREAGDLYQVEAMLRHLGMVGMLSGDHRSANARFMEALQVARDIDNRLAQFYGLTEGAWYAASTGRARVAARLFGAADALGTQTGAEMRGPLIRSVSEARQVARKSLGGPSFDAEYAKGTRMGRDEALRLALGEADPVQTDAPDGGHGASLARRELEVARLIAEGMTNKQVAARLFISEATVASHVRHIMDKLGVGSRSQIAVWMTSAPRGTEPWSR